MPVAAEIGASFCLNMFSSTLTVSEGRCLITTYRERLKNSAFDDEATAAVAIAGVCAETTERAQSLARSTSSFILPRVVGDPGTCRSLLEDVAVGIGVSHLIFVDLCSSIHDRLRSYSLLAEQLLRD